MAPHSSTLAWKIPWMEEPGRLQSLGSLTSLSLFTFMHWRRQWQPTPVFLPEESQGRGAWWASVYGVAQSRTRLKRLGGSSSSLELTAAFFISAAPLTQCGLHGFNQLRLTRCLIKSGTLFETDIYSLGFLADASGKESACQRRRSKRCIFDPWVRKVPWRRTWQFTSVFLPGESHGQRSPVGYSPWGCKELDTTEHTHTYIHS